MSVWQPQAGPQSLAIAAQFVPELMFGGARGGGKSDFLLGDYAQDIDLGAAWAGILFRKSYPELEELIKRAKEIYLPLGAVYKEGKNIFEFPSGATLKMRHLEQERDASKYQGHQYTWVGWDELTNWVDQNAYNMLKACVRSAKVIDGKRITNKRIRCSANPGGKGHQWVKAYFVDPCPMGGMFIENKRMFIRSLLTDNKLLTAADPEYENNLRELGSEDLVRAWLEGDWNVVTGAYFPEFSIAKHVIKPFKIPQHWTRFRSGDWGSSSPFSIGWWAVSDGYQVENGPYLPAGAIIRYREWYGCGPRPNTGIRKTGAYVARGIKEREIGEKINYGVLDPSAWRVDNGPCVAESMAVEKVYFRKADNGRVNGWDQVRNRLVGTDDTGPMMYFFETCHHTIRTFPALQHDTDNPEDVDTDGEDHAGDDIRYACMSRPYRTRKPREAKPIKLLQNATYDELWQMSAENASVYTQL